MSRTDDVIELGSSDEESRPPAKKHKPTPNAMVHIPHRLPGITIRPAKSSSLKMDIPSKRIPIKKTVNRVPNPLAMGVKVNDRPLLNKTLQMVPDVPAAQCNFKPNSVKLLKKVSAPIQVLSGTIKPIQKISMPIQGLPGSIKPIKKVSIPNRSLPGSVKAFPIKIKRANNSDGHPGGKPIVLSGFKQNSVHLREPTNLKKNMSSCMIVKRMKLNQNMSPAKVKEQLLNKPGDVLTVEIEDDDTNVQDKGYTGPQWYMPPEDENVNNDLEMENNSEPQCSQLVEITIEDSPVKPPHKQTCEIGKEYAVTIEDSPVQLAHKENSSESEDDNYVQENKKDYHSKKKLHYPTTSSPKQTLEVELEPIATPALPENKAIKTCVLASETIEIEESPVKINPIKETSEVDTPKKVLVQNPTIQPVTMKSLTETNTDTRKSTPVEIEDVESSQFHPTYQSFIDLCFKLENSDDMKKIVEKKIKGYYLQVPKEYSESEEFLDMVSGKIISMKSSPEKMYLYIKDVVDELNLQRKMAKTKVEVKDEKRIEAEKFLYGKESQFDAKRQKQIRKLEKTLKKLHRAIQKLEEQEVDFDDEEDSVYLLTERYKERMVKVHAKFCQLTKTKMPSEPRVYIDARPGQPQGPAKRLEKWINRKVPLGTPLPFPDFHDVLHCVKEANEQDVLGWNDVDVMEEARDLFTRCGKKLQRRRQENEWRLAVSRIPADVDPAEASEELRRKLQDNRQTATTKEAEVLKKFADKQNQLNLEPIEIGDKEADDSPADSEEEEQEAKNEREALDKEKRKDRIKRLLQENKVPADNTENIVDKVQTDDDNNPDSIKEKIDSVMEKSAVDKEKDSFVMESLDETLNNTKENTDSELISTKKSKDAEEVANENDEINSLSDSSKVGSDIDELHLLQKLHTSNEIEDSSLDSSDSESPIDISDSLESNSDNEDRKSVISIENSSYSENESTQDNMDIGNKKDTDSEKQHTSDKQEKQLNDIPLKDGNTDNVATENVVHEEAPTQTIEVEYSSLGNARKIITSDNDVCQSAEEILLASSEEDNNKDSPNNDCMNVDDDELSISETCIDFQDNTKIKERPNNVPNSSANNENPKDNTIEIEIEGLNGDKRLSGEKATLKNTCSESKIAMSV